MKRQSFLNHHEPSLRLSACLICAFANLSIGQIHRARCSLSAVKNSLNSNATGNHRKMRAVSAFVAGAAAALLHLPLPEEMPSVHDYLPLLPPGLPIFALYGLAHYTYLQEEYSKSLGIVETALALQKDVYPIPTIFWRTSRSSLRYPGGCHKKRLAGRFSKDYRYYLSIFRRMAQSSQSHHWPRCIGQPDDYGICCSHAGCPGMD